MTAFEILALLLGLAVLIGLVKAKLLKPPPAIGLTAMALLAAGAVVALDLYLPGLRIGDAVRGLLRAVDFRAAPVDAILGGLLFAAALHVDLSAATRMRLRLALTAFLGVLITTFAVGGAVWLAATVLGFAVPLVWALVFGALIAPTDPIAVLGMARAVRAPQVLEARVMAESAFSAGATLMVFAILLAIATGTLPIQAGPEAGQAFLVAMGGGLGLGLAAGLIAFMLLRWIDDQGLTVLVSLALLIGVYAGAGVLRLNAPLAALGAGLVVGLETRRLPMAADARAYLSHFWLLADALLKTLLFLFIGLEAAGLDLDGRLAALAGVAVLFAIAARWLAVAAPLAVLRLRERLPPGARRLLVWGGLRGGLSVALALSLPRNPQTEPLLALACAVVAVSIVAQALTLVPVARRRIRREVEAGLYDVPRPPAQVEPTLEGPPPKAAPSDAEVAPRPEPPPLEREFEREGPPRRPALRQPPPPRVPTAPADIPRPEIVAEQAEARPADEGTAPPRPEPVDAGRAPAPSAPRNA